MLLPERMARYFIIWVSCGMLSTILLAEGKIVCTRGERLLKEMPSDMTLPTHCLMECSVSTFHKKMQLQDNRNIRFNDCTVGDHGEYCWPMDLRCYIGESFQQAFVVLPVDSSVAGQEQMELKSTAPMVASFTVHNSSTALTCNCGLCYNVTHTFNTYQSYQGLSFCVQIDTQQNALDDGILRCAPFLVTFWQRQPKQEGGG